MKKAIFFFALVITSLVGYSQTTAIERDSVAKTTDFQTKARIATLSAANLILADPGQPQRVRQYAQLIVTDPIGASGWLLALSYGFITNPSMNYDSPQVDFDYTITTLFSKYAFAYYRE